MSTEGVQMSLLDDRTELMPDGRVTVYAPRTGGWLTIHPYFKISREILLARSRAAYAAHRKDGDERDD